MLPFETGMGSWDAPGQFEQTLDLDPFSDCFQVHVAWAILNLSDFISILRNMAFSLSIQYSGLFPYFWKQISGSQPTNMLSTASDPTGQCAHSPGSPTCEDCLYFGGLDKYMHVPMGSSDFYGPMGPPDPPADLVFSLS